MQRVEVLRSLHVCWMVRGRSGLELRSARHFPSGVSAVDTAVPWFWVQAASATARSTSRSDARSGVCEKDEA